MSCSCNYTSCHVSKVTSGVTSPCKAITSAAHEEKHELESLNDRLAAYITRVRSVRQSAGEFDASGYRDAVRTLEEEIVLLKDTYGRELERLRNRVESATCEKSTYAARCDTTDMVIRELRAKLSEETEMRENLSQELSVARKDLLSAKQQVTELHTSLSTIRSELKTAPERGHLDVEMIEARKRLEAEMKCRREAEEYIRTLREKLDFEIQIRHRENNELQQRLKTASDIIRCLETKLKDVTSVPNIDMTDILRKLREGTMVELRKYQSETEEALGKNLTALKEQIESEKFVRSGLHLERSRMEEVIAELRARLADTDGKMTSLIEQKKAVEDTLRTERYRSSMTIQQLEDKLAQMNDIMINKVKECTNARDAQVSLKAEIDTFKAIMDEGEKRISTNHVNSLSYCDRTIPDTTSTTKASCHLKGYADYSPAPPLTPRRRPTSAHPACLYGKPRARTPATPAERYPVFSSDLPGASCYGSGKIRTGCSSDDMFLSSRYGNGKKVTVEFNPGVVRNVGVSDCLEVSGKAVNGCYSQSFPKRVTPCLGRRPTTNRPSSGYHLGC